MARTKERRKIIHTQSTHEIFCCLADNSGYSQLLLQHGGRKEYNDFLLMLLEKNFYRDQEKKTTVKQLATDFKTDPIKVAKWVKKIYDDIFELNYNQPLLFQTEPIKVLLHIRHYDDGCVFYTSFTALPREYESINFPFVKAKTGAESFWIKRVQHEITEGKTNIVLSLHGGFLNKYREFALDKALFQGWIGFMDVYDKHEIEIDNELKNIYRQ